MAEEEVRTVSHQDAVKLAKEAAKEPVNHSQKGITVRVGKVRNGKAVDSE